MPKFNKPQRKISISDTGFSIGHFEVDKRLAFSGETKWHRVESGDFASGLQCQPRWSRAFVYPEALELLIGNVEYIEAVKFLASNRAVVVPKGFAMGRNWLVEQESFDSEVGSISPFDYLLQLSHKRCFGRIIARALERKNGSPPTVDSLRSEILEFRFGNRRFLRANLAGDLSHPCQIDQSDEFLLNACYESIICGHDALLITTDKTVLEQFITLLCRLERDYRAAMLSDWAFASRPSQEFPNLEECRNLGFISEMQILTLNAQEVEKLMPTDPWPINLHCWLIEPEPMSMKVLPISFRAERPMHKLFSIRNENRGRNAALPDNVNVHFSWQEQAGGLIGRIHFAKGSQLAVGSEDFPLAIEPERELSSWIYELFDVQNLCDPIALPWHS